MKQLDNSQKVYILLGVIILTLLGVWGYLHSEADKAIAAKKKGIDYLTKVRGYGQKLYDIQQIAIILKATGEKSVHSGSINQLLKRNKLKDRIAIRSNSVTRRDYVEVQYKLSLDGEYLENIIRFLQSIENIDKKKISISNLILKRDDKDKDLWKASVTISQKTPKDIRKSSKKA